MRVSDFIEQSNKAGSPKAIVALMERAASDLGFDRYAYCALTGHDRYLASNNPAPAVALNYPTSWTDYYFEHSYQTRDPVMLYARELEKPFLWDSLEHVFELDGAQRKIMRQAEEAKLKNGVGVPLHGAHSNVCLLTFASGDGHADPGAEIHKLGALAVQFHIAYSEIGRCEPGHRRIPSLSRRERECLQWIERGKTTWDISRILSISENTVNTHIKNAFAKLGTNRRITAVVKAIHYGIIEL